jgi:hypothetical protein
LGIAFPNLTSLTLVSSSTDLLQHLSTPQLKHLRLEYSFSRTILGDICSFLKSSAYSLTQLVLGKTRIDNLELIDLLKLLPYLTELSIFSSSRTVDAFLIGLHSQKTVPCVAPELKCLSLNGAFAQSDADLLLDMIESRCQDGDDEMACVPLLSVQLYTFKLFDAQTKMRIRALFDILDIDVFELISAEWVRIKDSET